MLFGYTGNQNGPIRAGTENIWSYYTKNPNRTKIQSNIAIPIITSLIVIHFNSNRTFADNQTEFFKHNEIAPNMPSFSFQIKPKLII